MNLESELDKHQALVLVQQRELNRVYKRKNYYKDLVKNSYKPVFKNNDSKLEIKIGRKKWILEKDKITSRDCILWGEWINYHENYLQLQGDCKKGGMMFIFSFDSEEAYNKAGDQGVELYFQPKDTYKHGKRYRYIANHWEVEEYQRSISKFITNTIK